VQSGLTSIIIVAADSGPGLADCIADALASEGPLEVVLSDNASQDGSLDAVLARCGGDARLRILRNGRNLGFGAGVNRAAADARGDSLLLLNPDCRIDAAAPVTLRRLAASWPRLGILGPRIVDAAGREEPAARRNDPTLRRALATLLGRDALGQGVNRPARADAGGAGEAVDAVSGAAMWIPREVFQRLGGFDEGYFLHCEDLDLCRRARDAGFAVVYTAQVSIVHAKGGSSRHRPVFVSWHKHRGMWRWFRRHDPAGRQPLLAAVVWAGLWCHFWLTAPARWLGGWRARRAQTAAAPARTAA